MNLGECLKSALQNIWSNKLRTFLTMLGIIIGISSVIMIISIGNGSQAAIEEEFESFGTPTIDVSLVSSRDIETRDIMSMDDYYMLKELDGVKYVSPSYSGSAYIKLLDPRDQNRATITGVTYDEQYISNINLLYGRYISANDVNLKSNVVIITDTTAVKVFGYSSEDVLGEKIKLKTWKGTNKFTVIGIIENENADTESEYEEEYPESVILPITSAMKLIGGTTLSTISVAIEDTDQTDVMKENIISALEDLHGNEDKYQTTDSTAMVDSINSILSYVTLFISFVAGISLLVGGIGVMNIMMVTVTERTREIGIRKSIGAKNKDIRLQFITEAIMLTGMGGLLGLVFGYFGGLIIGKYAGVTPIMSFSSIIAAVGISMGIGIIFGVMPANKAALLDPIEALRFE